MRKTAFVLLLTAAFTAQASEVRLNPMESFSGLSKSAVLQKRVRAVQKSTVFGGEPYTPSDAVYNQIADNAAWIGAHEISCYGINGSRDISAGASRESVGILNPELLFYINIASYEFKKNTGSCSAVDYLIPYKVDYDSSTETITAYFNYTAFYKKNKAYFGMVLHDANARDMEYHYAFAAEARNIRFKTDRNLSAQIVQTAGFYHLGGSCGAQGGCNNYSPYNEAYHFYLKGLPAVLTINLWAERPQSAHETTEMTYRMIFN